MGLWLKFLVVSVFLFLLIPLSVPWVSAAGEELVPLEVVEAEEALASAYEAVLQAEEAGANVSDLLDKLNVGSEYLAEAYASVRLEDFESAGHFAGLCVEAVDDVSGEAVLLRDDATRLGKEDFVERVFGSTVGVVIVVVFGFVFWLIFKWRYFGRVLESKPEVSYGES